MEDDWYDQVGVQRKPAALIKELSLTSITYKRIIGIDIIDAIIQECEKMYLELFEQEFEAFWMRREETSVSSFSYAGMFLDGNWVAKDPHSGGGEKAPCRVRGLSQNERVDALS